MSVSTAARPLVSIVTACLNAGPMLARYLESCAHQTYPSLEIVFVDNGSTDGSLEAAQAFAASGRVPMTVLGCARRGQCAALNLGFERARGDFIQWLDSDDEIAIRKIEHQVAALEAAPDVDVAYGDWMFLSHAASGAATHPRPGRATDDPLRDLLLDRWRTPNSYLVRRRLADRLHAIQAFHPDSFIATDREYFTLAAIYAKTFLYVPDSIAIHNDWSPAQVSKSKPRAQRVRVLRRHFARFREHADLQPPGRITAEHRELLDQSWDLYTVPRVGFYWATGGYAALAPSGEKKPLTPMEALLLMALPGAEPCDVEGMAFVAATNAGVARAAAQTNVFIDPALEIHRALQGLAARGVLERAKEAELEAARLEAHAAIAAGRR